MDFATDGFCNCKVSVLLLAQFFLGGYRHSGRVLRAPILPLGKKSKCSERGIVSLLVCF